ncbi:hypothetical protein [Bradyrhizobium sp. Ec3.3]|uniref:beta strand repeat-containing protein n=1 Tax=Bradyrhizobium sp. Ec3.3 TaxID=189753 RepID=UPI000412A80A|nr:hypothetical protein [Bradyrhizobium sp. Ec3.3]
MKSGRSNSLIGVLALIALLNPAQSPAQLATPPGFAVGTSGQSCSGSSIQYGWPDANGQILKCSSNVWSVVTQTAGAGGANGQVQFNSSNALAGNSNLFWDNTNNRLGIGTAAPGSLLSVGATNAVSIDNSGNVTIATSTAATSGTQQVSSPNLVLSSNYWTGSSSAANNLTMSWTAPYVGSIGPVLTFSPSVNLGSGNEVRFGFGNTLLESWNINDNEGAAFGETYNTAYFGLKNVTGATSGVIPNGSAYGFLALNRTGVVGTVQHSMVNTAPSYRNVLDDGSASAKVGLGTTAPLNKLDVSGGEVVGAGYIGTTTAPSNGLIVQGSVGIGTQTALNALDVNGGNISVNNGGMYFGYANSGSYPLRIVAPSSASARLQIGGPGGSILFASNTASTTGVYANSGALSLYNGPLAVGTTTALNMLDVSGGSVIGAGYIGTTTAPTNGLVVQGNVGIGTSSPDMLLTVRNAVNNSNFVPVQDLIVADTSGAGYVDKFSFLVGATAARGGAIEFGETGGSFPAIAEQMRAGLNVLDFAQAGGYPITFSTNNCNTTSYGYISCSERMRIDGSGNVGIGTTTALNKLDVSGGEVVGAGFIGTTTAPTNGLAVQGNIAVGTSAAAAALTIASAPAMALSVVNSAATSLGGITNNAVFRAQSGGAGSQGYVFTSDLNSGIGNPATGNVIVVASSAEQMRVNSTGVGIGTTSPMSKLQVNAGEVQIGSSGASCTANTAGALRYNSGSFLVCNGASWSAPSYAAGGSDGQVQYNSSNALAGSSSFTWDYTNNRLGIGTNVPLASLDLSRKTDAALLPVGTTGQQPTCNSNTTGGIRYNSSTGYPEFCSGSAWIPFKATGAPPGSGYFIMDAAASTYLGNLGSYSAAGGNTGLAAGNAICLHDLTTFTNWWGYATANAAGILAPSHVFAFLCDGTSCNTLSANTTYYVGSNGDSTVGGASFTTDSSGNGPNSSMTFSLGSGWGYVNPAKLIYWTGRGTGSTNTWPATSGSSTCSGWTDSTNGNPGVIGAINGSSTARWSNGGGNCGQGYYLVCYVNP